MVGSNSGDLTPDPDHVLCRGVGVEKMSCALSGNGTGNRSYEVFTVTAVTKNIAKGECVIVPQARVELASGR
jgi:hypothetical protein